MITKIRAQQITLDLPTENSDVWVRAVIQTIIKDENYKTVQTIDRTDAVHRKFSDFALNILTISDPVTGRDIQLSGVGLGFAVSEFVKQWILLDIPATSLNDQGDVIKE